MPNRSGGNIAGNKYKGIRAALISDEYTAEHAVRHNCANYFSIPARTVDKKMFELIYNIRIIKKLILTSNP